MFTSFWRRISFSSFSISLILPRSIAAVSCVSDRTWSAFSFWVLDWANLSLLLVTCFVLKFMCSFALLIRSSRRLILCSTSFILIWARWISRSWFSILLVISWCLSWASLYRLWAPERCSSNDSNKLFCCSSLWLKRSSFCSISFCEGAMFASSCCAFPSLDWSEIFPLTWLVIFFW